MYETRVTLEQRDVLRPWGLRPGSVNQMVLSPPYWRARDYNHSDQIGNEPLHDCLAWARNEPASPNCCFICNSRLYMQEAHAVLHNIGTAVIVIGDTYGGSSKGPTDGMNKSNIGSIAPHLAIGTPGNLKKKDKAGIPWRLAMALQQDGWYWRAEIPWIKTSGMPSSYQDRPVLTHETILLFSKRQRYYWDPFATLIPSRSETDLGPAYYGYEPETADLSNADNTFRRTTDWSDDNIQQLFLYHTEKARALVGLMEGSGALVADSGDIMLIKSPHGGNQHKHYAGYHPDLIRPLIQAGTSRHGVCANCLTPYRRIVMREITGHNRRVRSQQAIADNQSKHVSDNMNHYKIWRTIDWRKACKCDCDEVSRPVVLDPFVGSGTTMRVALETGCDFIGFDVNEKYLDSCRTWLTPRTLPVVRDPGAYDFGLFATVSKESK